MQRPEVEPTRRDDTAEDTVARLRIHRPVTPVNFTDSIIHINGGLVVSLGNTCAESKGSEAEREFLARAAAVRL